MMDFKQQEYLERRLQGETVCAVCGYLSSGVCCWPCSQVISGNHPVTKVLYAEIERLKREIAESGRCEVFGATYKDWLNAQ